MTRWIRPHELEQRRQRDLFDPVSEGARHKLSRDASLAIWKRVVAEATDHDGRFDVAQAEQRFRVLAARLAARGGRLQAGVGRRTLSETEAADPAARPVSLDELAAHVPGRRTRVEVEAATAAPASAPVINAPMSSTALRAQLPRSLGMQLWAPVTQRPASLTTQMRRTFGTDASDIAISTGSARAAGAEGVAIGEQVYIAPGYYDLTTVKGRERLGHEVAHVLQQRRGRGLSGGRITGGERAKLESEADRAGRAFARGKPFAVQGRAPGNVALFKGAPAATAATAPTKTTIDLKAGGRIERKPADPAPANGAPAPGKSNEQLLVTYGGIQASNPFTVVRDASGDVTKLVGSGTITLPASRYLKPIQLTIALGPDGYLGAKLMNTSTSAINLGGLTVRGGTLSAGIDHGQLTYALDGATLTLPKNIGEGSLSIQGNGAQEPSFDASLSINVPKLQPGVMTFHADATGYKATGSTGVDFKQASGTVTFGLEKVGDDKALWSAAGTIGYNSERLSGQVSVQYNADGALSGDGSLNFQIADFLTGQATVAIDKEGHVAVNGEIRPPNETQLFPEKKIEQTFFHNSIEFPIWGISIPVVGSVGLIAFIEGSMGYRVGVGAGVMRNIVLSGSYSTDPSVQPTFQIAGEIFIPAFAELLISIGGGIKLDAFIADIGGGLKIDGRAGFYGGLSVRPTLAYEGGKYRLVGQAILGGDVGLQAQLDAFAKLHVGKWMFSWEKEWDWKLGEWDKWLGLHLGMEADLDYTLGQPLSPDIFKLKKPDALDVQAIAKSAVPEDGMPAQGHKGAENQDTEFHAKSGGAAAPATSTAAQPKIAPTPAGAAGHKNQDTKGKDVKPAAPPKPAPAKKAKGKDASQTGPNPQNKSKPNETKLDATPIVEPFTMSGESHQLIVQLGPSGHVDMASKRERLSVKVGQAVGKLIAKHAPPQQVTELKALGALAKNGDQMALKAKTPDKDGTKKVAHQIAEYGAKWGVKDLDEVAVKAPHAITAHPVHLDRLSDPLSKALTAAHTGQVVANKPGDPKELTRQLLEHHADAHFDFASAQLTLPAPKAAVLQTATSLEQLGAALVQQTGVAKITLKKTEQKGESKLELTGAIGSASAILATADLAGEIPKTLTIPGPNKLSKLSDGLAKDIANAASGATVWQASVTDPKQVTENLLHAHPAAHFDPATKNLQLPPVQISALAAASTLVQLGQLIGQETGVSKVTFVKSSKGFSLHVHINPETTGVEGSGVPFVPIDKVAKMSGGQEHVKIIDKGGRPAIVDSTGAEISEIIVDALDGPFIAARNQAGKAILRTASSMLDGLTGKFGGIDLNAGISPDTQKLLDSDAASVVSTVERIGEGLDVATLKRAAQVQSVAQKSLIFDMTIPGSVANGSHRANFEAEVRRQLALQQAGLNEMTLDTWAANIDTYKADQSVWINKLSDAARAAVLDEVVRRIDDTYNTAQAKSAEIKKASASLATIQQKLKQGGTYTVAKALSELTGDDYIKNNFVGRFGNEGKFRETHAEGIAAVLATMHPKWEGLKSSSGKIKDAVTHNPDQIAGGFGMLPDIAVQKKPGPGEDTTAWDAYLTVLESYIGASKVNIRIGPGWAWKIESAYRDLKTLHPKEGSYPLWRMNFILEPNYK